jgi:hypothetical protein
LHFHVFLTTGQSILKLKCKCLVDVYPIDVNPIEVYPIEAYLIGKGVVEVSVCHQATEEQFLFASTNPSSIAIQGLNNPGIFICDRKNSSLEHGVRIFQIPDGEEGEEMRDKWRSILTTPLSPHHAPIEGVETKTNDVKEPIDASF